MQSGGRYEPNVTPNPEWGWMLIRHTPFLRFNPFRGWVPSPLPLSPELHSGLIKFDPFRVVYVVKERRNNNFPIWAAAFFIGLRCFVGRVAKAMLPSRASSDKKILAPKTWTYYCDVPKFGTQRITSMEFQNTMRVHNQVANLAFGIQDGAESDIWYLRRISLR